MTTTNHDHAGRVDCPVCLVRALTEGEPKVWWPNEPASVKGVVLWSGSVPSPYAMLATDTIPVVDLWLGGTDRVRISGVGAMLGEAIKKAAPTVGDTLTVTYIGQGTIERGKMAGRAYRMHTVEIERGHH